MAKVAKSGGKGRQKQVSKSGAHRKLQRGGVRRGAGSKGGAWEDVPENEGGTAAQPAGGASLGLGVIGQRRRRSPGYRSTPLSPQQASRQRVEPPEETKDGDEALETESEDEGEGETAGGAGLLAVLLSAAHVALPAAEEKKDTESESESESEGEGEGEGEPRPRRRRLPASPGISAVGEAQRRGKAPRFLKDPRQMAKSRLTALRGAIVGAISAILPNVERDKVGGVVQFLLGRNNAAFDKNTETGLIQAFIKARQTGNRDLMVQLGSIFVGAGVTKRLLEDKIGNEIHIGDRLYTDMRHHAAMPEGPGALVVPQPPAQRNTARTSERVPDFIDYLVSAGYLTAKVRSVRDSSKEVS